MHGQRCCCPRSSPVLQDLCRGFAGYRMLQGSCYLGETPNRGGEVLCLIQCLAACYYASISCLTVQSLHTCRDTSCSGRLLPDMHRQCCILIADDLWLHGNIRTFQIVCWCEEASAVSHDMQTANIEVHIASSHQLAASKAKIAGTMSGVEQNLKPITDDLLHVDDAVPGFARAEWA